MVAAGIYLALPWWSRAGWLRRAVERTAAASGFDVAVGALHIGHDLGLYLDGIAASRDGADPFLSATAASVRLAPRGLLRGQPIDLHLTQPHFHLDRLPRRLPAAPPSSPPPPAPTTQSPPTLPLHTLAIDDGWAHLGAGREPIGPITLAIDARQTGGQETRLFLLLAADLPAIEARGTIDAADGMLTFRAQLDWPDVPLATALSRLDLDPAGNIAGAIDATGEITGNLEDWQASGSLRLRDLGWSDGDTSVTAAAGAVELSLDPGRVTAVEPGLRFTDITWRGAGLTGSAEAATVTAAAVRGAGEVRISGALSLGRVAGSDGAAERVVDGLAVRGSYDLQWNAPRPPLLRGELAATQGEVLWHRFYADIARRPVVAAASLSRDARGNIDVTDIRVRAGAMASATGRARLDAAGELDTARLRVEVDALGDLYAIAVAEPLQESSPFLARAVAGGSLDAQVTYHRGGADMSLRGRLRLRDGILSDATSGFAVRGLRLDVPFQLGRGDDHARQTGAARLGELHWGGLRLSDVSAELYADDDRIGLAAPLSVPLYDGLLRVRELLFDDLRTPQPRAALAVSVVDVDLEQLSAAGGLPPLRGTVSGEIPNITMTGGTLRSDGEIRIDVFGGRIAVRNLGVERAFSPLPAFGLDLDFDEISLGRLTETFAVGRISGVARGAVGNLLIVDRQPVSFDAWMETVERPGVAQRISVSAIRQLSILGGSGGDPISQGVLGLFEDYRYAKMGFRCRLENDRFALRGVERIDGREYLVVGARVPPRVNVVSHTQVISFPDMVRRLQRIFAAAASDE